VEPDAFERCAEIREWLFERGVARATLLVIPARRFQQFHDARPEMVGWLVAWRRAGDAIAQHGFRHEQVHGTRGVRGRLASWQGSGAAEFGGLGKAEVRSALTEGRRVLLRAGIAPGGFVAPAYVHSPALRGELSRRFDWWAGLARVYARRLGRPPRATIAPALCLGTSRPLRAAMSPPLVRAAALAPGRVVRLDVHPADFDSERHVTALERVLDRARDRRPVTYDALADMIRASEAVGAGTPAALRPG
jgi:predicted deacetylase